MGKSRQLTDLNTRLFELGQKAIRIKQIKKQLKQLEREYDAEEQQVALLQKIKMDGLEIKPVEPAGGENGVDKV